jgi:hypothetical protein
MVMDSGDVAGIEWADKRKGQGATPGPDINHPTPHSLEGSSGCLSVS